MFGNANGDGSGCVFDVRWGDAQVVGQGLVDDRDVAREGGFATELMDCVLFELPELIRDPQHGYLSGIASGFGLFVGDGATGKQNRGFDLVVMLLEGFQLRDFVGQSGTKETVGDQHLVDLTEPLQCQLAEARPHAFANDQCAC